MKLEKEETILKNELSSLKFKETIIAKIPSNRLGKPSIAIKLADDEITLQLFLYLVVINFKLNRLL